VYVGRVSVSNRAELISISKFLLIIFFTYYVLICLIVSLEER